MSNFESARTVLANVFGFTSFRKGQDDVVRAVLSGKDVLAVMPTGGGKSICYQVPALVFPACTLVVSPLVALMTDQVDALRQKGVAAYALHSGLAQSELSAILNKARNGHVKLLYVAPERLESKQFRQEIASVPLSLLAVDEAHCISEWGHDFRPSYRSIPILFQERPRIPIVALTATATPDVRTDIVKNLGLRENIEIVRGFDRPNLAFKVVQTPSKVEFITVATKKNPNDSILVYAGSRRRVDTIAEELRKRKIGATAYHAGKTNIERSLVQDRFLSGNAKLLVATNAFGMGIDKSNIRHVIHADLTLTLEAYYQEAGRAGRDGLPSTCTLLYQPEDKRLMDYFIASTYPEPNQIRDVVTYLFGRVAQGTASVTPLLVDDASISIDLHKPMGSVRGVLAVMERYGIVMRSNPDGFSTLRLRTTRDRLLEFISNSPPERKPSLTAIARLVQHQSSGNEVSFALKHLLRESGISINEFSESIRALHVSRLIRYSAPQANSGYVMLASNTDQAMRMIDSEEISRRREHAVSKLDVVVQYVETTQCKRNFILNYFHDPEIKGNCNRCTSCLNEGNVVRIKEGDSEVLQNIVKAVAEVDARFGRNVIVDIITGTVSSKTVAYRLDRAETWGSGKFLTRAHVMRVLDEGVRSGVLIRTSGTYPLIALSAEGRKLGKPLPKPLEFAESEINESDPEVLKDLVRLRAEVGMRNNVVPTSLLSMSQLQRLAVDKPSKLSELEPGRHGASLFLAQYGQEIIEAIGRSSNTEVNVSERADAQTRAVAQTAARGGSLADVALRLRLTPAATAQYLQRAIESGLNVNRGNLVSDSIFEQVMEFMRNHRYAKLRHVREHLGSAEITLPELRIAMALVRRELYGVVE